MNLAACRKAIIDAYKIWWKKSEWKNKILDGGKIDLPCFPAHKTHFFPEKYDLNSTCVLCAEGKYYFQTYK